jgi:hypothetical protein
MGSLAFRLAIGQSQLCPFDFVRFFYDGGQQRNVTAARRPACSCAALDMVAAPGVTHRRYAAAR